MEDMMGMKSLLFGKNDLQVLGGEPAQSRRQRTLAT